MDPTFDLSEQFNLIFTIATMGLFGAFLSLAYVAERSGLAAMRWLIQLIVAAGLALSAMIGMGLAMSETLVDQAEMRSALERMDRDVEPGDESEIDPAGDADRGEDRAGSAGDVAEEAGEAAELDALTPALSAIGRWMIGLALLGFLLLLPFLRRMLARWIPIDPDRLVHLVALEYVLLLILISASTGIFVQSEALPLDEIGEATTLAGLWAQALGFVLIAFLGVGLAVARSGRETLERLGLTQRFSVRWWLGATLLGLATGFAVDQLWQFVSPETLETVEDLSDALFGDLIQTGWAGALTIGLSAGIGEELLFRGAAQPKLGIVLTSLLFAIIHTQYGVSPALLQIFIIGFLLGLTRKHAGTWTAIGTHASYNFVLAVLSMCDEAVLSCPF